MLPKLSNSEITQAALWAFAFTGVAVLVGVGKVQPTMLENLLFALVGALTLKGKANEPA